MEELIRSLWGLLKSGFTAVGPALKRLWAFLLSLRQESEYLRRPENKRSLQKLKREITKVLSSLLPKKGKGWLRLGLGDPYETGRVMELFAALYPLYGEKRIEIQPEFSERVLETRMDVKGRVYVFTLLSAALRLFTDRNLRKMYRHFTEERYADGRGENGL